MAGEICTIQRRKYCAFVLLMVPAITMFLENSNLVKENEAKISVLRDVINFLNQMASRMHTTVFKPYDYILFFLVSLAIWVISLVLFYCSGWRLRDKDKRRAIGTFIRTFLSRLFIGELSKTLYGLFVFVMFAVTLTAWLPDAFESGNLWFLSGTTFYFLSLVFITAFVYPPRIKELSDSGKPFPARYLVYALSVPRGWGWENVQNLSCDKLRRNAERINILPLYVSLYYHLTHPESKLEELFLIVTKDGHLKDEKTRNEIKKALEIFFNKISNCLMDEGIGVKFRIYWWESEYHPDVKPTTAGNGERTIDVRFIVVSDSNDVKGTFEEIKQCRKLMEAIEKDSKDVVIHLTGGTATMSIALMFHAIKGDTHAEYMKQGITDREPEELLVGIDMDVFDLEDLVRELSSYYERIYEKEKS